MNYIRILFCFLFVAVSALPVEADEESTALVTEWPREVQNAVVQLHVRKKIPYDRIYFDPPGSDTYDDEVKRQVFQSEGGDVEYQVSAYNNQPYTFSFKNRLKDVGTAHPEILAILADIDRETCNAINKELDLPRREYLETFFQKIKGDKVEYNYIPELDTFPNMEYIRHEDPQTPVVFINTEHYEGCYKMPDGKYYYLQVMAAL